MVVVHREAGLRFVLYTDDHEPAHVHVYGDGTAKIILAGADGGPELVSSRGLTAADLRKAVRIVSAEQAGLIEKWRELHG